MILDTCANLLPSICCRHPSFPSYGAVVVDVVVVVVVVGHVVTLSFTCPTYSRRRGLRDGLLAIRARIVCHLSAVAIGHPLSSLPGR